MALLAGGQRVLEAHADALAYWSKVSIYGQLRRVRGLSSSFADDMSAVRLPHPKSPWQSLEEVPVALQPAHAAEAAERAALCVPRASDPPSPMEQSGGSDRDWDQDLDDEYGTQYGGRSVFC